MTEIRRKLLGVAAFLLLAIAHSATATAQGSGPSPDDLEAAKKAYGDGAAAFDRNDFAEAVSQFKKSYRLSRNPLLLYNIGYALEAADDKELALFYYKKFLTETPKNAQHRDVAQERAEALSVALAGKAEKSEELGAEEKKPDSEKPDETPDEEKPKPTAFEHNVIGEVPPGKPIDVTAFAPQNVGWKVYLHYRASGASKFTTVEMTPRYSELVARIPANLVRGNSIAYYVEARDIGDQMVARSGKSSSPNLIIIDDAAKARFYPDFEGSEDDDSVDLGGSGGSSPAGPGDDRSGDRRNLIKWGATGGAIGFVALSATFFAIASDASSSLEGAAVKSSMQDTCTQGRPCQPFSDSERSLQARGKRFETLGNVFFAFGLASGVTAGVLWYLDSKKPKSAQSGVTAAPAIGPDYLGGAAQVRF